MDEEWRMTSCIDISCVFDAHLNFLSFSFPLSVKLIEFKLSSVAPSSHEFLVTSYWFLMTMTTTTTNDCWLIKNI